MQVLFRYALFATAIALTAACGSDSSTEQAEQEPLVVYSSRAEQLIQPIFEAFTEDTGIAVQYITDEPQPLIERLKAEGEQTPASVLLTVDAGNLWFAASEGVLQPLESEALASIVPAYLRDAGNRWFGLSLRARTIVYDARSVDPQMLHGYADLADPKWRGKLCLRTSKKVYNQSLVAMLIAMYGEPRAEEIVAGWVSNLATDVFSNDSKLIEAIVDGRCEVGVVNTYYLGRMLREQALPVGLHWPSAEDDGVHVNVSGAGVVKHAANPQAAKRLLEWLAGGKGQMLFASLNLEFSVRDDVDRDPITAAWGTFSPMQLPLENAGIYQAQAVKLMDRVGYR